MDEQKLLLYSPPQAPPSGFNPPPVALPTQRYPPPSYVDFGDTPVCLRCPNCQYDVVTTVELESGTCTCIALCVWAGRRQAALCIDDFKDAVHTCPICHHTCGKC